MYLTEINKVTGLVDIEKDNDGVLAIKEFNRLINDKNLGIKAFTVVALICDYLSPFRHYIESDRQIKALDNIYEDRKAIKMKSEPIQEAMAKYYSLQYNHVLEEKKLLEELKVKKINEIKNEEDESEKIKKLKQLSQINNELESFNKKNEGKDLYTESPVRNGYKLSRLEQKLEDPKSFYYVKERTKIKKPEQTI